MGSSKASPSHSCGVGGAADFNADTCEGQRQVNKGGQRQKHFKKKEKGQIHSETNTQKDVVKKKSVARHLSEMKEQVAGTVKKRKKSVKPCQSTTA